MKNTLFKSIFSLVILLSNCLITHATNDMFIRIYNNSNIDIYSNSSRLGCTDLCHHPDGELVNPLYTNQKWGIGGKDLPAHVDSECCGWTGTIIKAKSKENDKPNSDTIGMNWDGPSFMRFYSKYPVYVYPMNLPAKNAVQLRGKAWKTKEDVTVLSGKNVDLYFPDDFDVTDDDKKALTSF